MKKLLLYLVALITMSTLSVDAFAATKPIYIDEESISGWSTLKLWWWGADNNESEAYSKLLGFEWGDINLLNPSDAVEEKVSITRNYEGLDGKKYLKVEIDERTQKLEFPNSSAQMSNVFTYVFKNSAGQIVQDTNYLVAGNVEAGGASNLPITVQYKSGANGWVLKDYSVTDGICTISDVVLYNGNGFNIVFKYAGDNSVYGMAIDDWKPAANESFESQYNNKQVYTDPGNYPYNDGKNFENGTAYDLTLNFNDLTYTIVKHGEVVEPEITYDYRWAAKDSAGNVFNLTLNGETYTYSTSNPVSDFYLECTEVKIVNGEESSEKTTYRYGVDGSVTVEKDGAVSFVKDGQNAVSVVDGFDEFGFSFTRPEELPASVNVDVTVKKEEEEDPTPAGDYVFYVGGSNFGWGPDDAYTDRYDYRTQGVKFEKVGDNVYQATGVNISGEYLSIYDDTYFDGTRESVKQYNYNADSGYELTGYVNPAMRLYNHFHGIQVKNTLNNATLTIFVNGSDYYMAITEAGVEPEFVLPKVTTVYFIDRQNWGNLHCYNYTDKGDLGGGNNDNNGIFPGQKMDDITENPAYAEMMKNIQGLSAQGYRVYKIDLTKTQLEADGYTMPKIIFSNGTSGAQTANLYLVKDGIYTNGTPSKLNEGQMAVKASDYLPRQWYKADAAEGEQCVYTYPNDEVSTPYNYIYVDVDHYTDTYNGGKRVSVQIEYTLNGETFVATGLSGTHYLSLVNINGKDYLRVAIAEDVIPNNTPIKLVVWENPENKYGGIKPDVSGNWSDQGCEYGVCDDNISVDKHLDCPMSSGCPLIFANATFTNGALFTRSSEQENILTMTMPTRMYVVDAANNEAFKSAGLQQANLAEGTVITNGTTATLKVNEIVAYDVTSTLKDAIYVIPGVPQNAKFYMLGAYDVVENGEVTSTAYHYFSNAKNFEMLPGNHYPFYYDQEGTYSITENYGKDRIYQISIEWADQTVSVRTEPKDNGFRLGQNDGSGYEAKDLHIAHFLFAVADDDKTQDKIHVMHPASFDPDTYKDSHSVQFSHNDDYSDFMTNDKNKVVSPEDYDARLFNEDGNDIESTHSSVAVRAYTAGLYTLKVANEKSETLNEASSDIPVRVIPTLESLGMNLNYLGIFDEETLNCSYAGDFVLNLGALPTSGSGFDEVDVNGVKYHWDENRIGFFPTMAEYKVAGKSNDEVLQIWWAYLDGTTTETPSVYAESSVVAKYNNLAVTANPFGTPAENGLKRFSYTNAMSADGIKAAKGFKVQMVQNGIASPVYIFNTTNETGTTGVDELGVEEGEAVYYDLNGVKVDGTNLAKGIYVKVVGTKATKVFVK